VAVELYDVRRESIGGLACETGCRRDVRRATSWDRPAQGRHAVRVGPRWMPEASPTCVRRSAATWHERVGAGSLGGVTWLGLAVDDVPVHTGVRTWPSIERVVSWPPAQGVVASTTCEAVVSVPTGHRVAASPTHQLVVTAASKE
jgi:hypothetical protein